MAISAYDSPSILSGMAFASVLLLVGLYLTCGLILIDIRSRRSAEYLITDRRIIIKAAGLVQSVSLFKVTGEPTTPRVTADGNIVFGSVIFGSLIRFWGPAHQLLVDDPCLDCLQDPLRAYRTIRLAQRRPEPSARGTGR